MSPHSFQLVMYFYYLVSSADIPLLTFYFIRKYGGGKLTFENLSKTPSPDTKLKLILQMEPAQITQ